MRRSVTLSTFIERCAELATEPADEPRTAWSRGVPVAISFAGIRKRYGARMVLDGIDVEIPPGTTTALLGLNGAGKSTLMRMAVDLVAPDQGTVTLYGQPAAVAAARRQVAWLPERFVPPAHLSGWMVLDVLLHQQHVALDAARAAAECASLAFDPRALAQPTGTYSKGMLQKLGLLACLLADPSSLVLDEPLSGLDPLARHCCLARLQVAAAAGTTLFISSHDLHDLGELCDRIIVLHAAKVAFDGAPAGFCAAMGHNALADAFLALARGSSPPGARSIDAHRGDPDGLADAASG
jgi:ABC-2 type transport system ATP-binding protein